MGCWLLTKHACAALAVATCFEPKASHLSTAVISSIASKLVSTMISLKHVGGTYAAHKALQDVLTMCQSIQSLRSIPKSLTNDLLQQITSPEYVKDSILRRSTGYALGYLAIMRSDLPKGASHTICPMVFSQLLRLSLPPETEVKAKLSALGFDDFKFQCIKDFPNLSFLPDKNYQVSDIYSHSLLLN